MKITLNVVNVIKIFTHRWVCKSLISLVIFQYLVYTPSKCNKNVCGRMCVKIETYIFLN